MSLLVYGIVEADTSERSGVGLDDQPLRDVAEGSLVAVVSEHHGADLKPTSAAVTAYERTVRLLMERGAILPARFGSVLDDEAAVRELLHRRRKDLLTRLRRVRGAVEIGLRAIWRDGARPRSDGDASQQSGTAYLRERLERRESAARVAGELDSLKPVALSARRTLAARPDVPVIDAYLVELTRVDEFVALVAQLDGDLDDVELECTGPWPPYSFAEGEPV